ncbi:DUF6771 family protein [Sphingomonas sp. Tas61C01]
MRERAALVLANHLAGRLERPSPAFDMDQLNVPLPPMVSSNGHRATFDEG